MAHAMNSPTGVNVDEYDSIWAKKNPTAHLIQPSSHDYFPVCDLPHSSPDLRDTINEPCVISGYRRQQSLLDEEPHHSDEESDDDRGLLPGVLLDGVEYNPTRILVEGWVHKKGTGNDLFGSRSWKARYCRLVLAEVEGSEIEIPLLLLYWFPSSDTPTTVITLESTVVVPMDRENKQDWTKYCFNIVHARGESKTTRCFTVPQKGRDSWVFAINDALYNYEKARRLLKQNVATASPNFKHLKPPEISSSDCSVELSISSSIQPPQPLPRSAPPRPNTQPESLLGEAFLIDLDW